MTDARTREDTDSQSRLSTGLSTARDAASRTLDRARDTLGDSSEKAAAAARRTVDGLEANPLGILVGGLALGAVAGALLPRSEREKQLLEPLGSKLGERARSAVAAAKDAGKGQLDELGINRDAATNQAKTLLDGVVKALSTAGAAAAQSAKGSSASDTPPAGGFGSGSGQQGASSS